MKSAIWHALNREYLELQAEKEKERQQLLAEGKIPQKVLGHF